MLADRAFVRAEPGQYLAGHALAFAEQAEQQVLGADVHVIELAGLAQRELKYFLGPRGERDVPAGHLLASADDVQYFPPGRFRADPGGPQRPGRHPVALPEQAEQQVLGADVAVVQRPGFLLAAHHHLARARD